MKTGTVIVPFVLFGYKCDLLLCARKI